MMYEKQESGMPWEAQKRSRKGKKRLILGKSERTKRAEYVDLVQLCWPWDLGKKIPVPNSKMGVTLRL